MKRIWQKILLILLAVSLLQPFAMGEDQKPATAKKKYRKSRLTHDETEAVADKRKLLLTTGEDKVVDMDFDVGGEKYVSIGNPQVVTFQIINVGGQRRQVVFKPLKAGETTVTIRNEEGTISIIFYVKVTGSNLLRQAGEIRDLLKDIEGIDVRIVGQKIIIDGEVLVPNDYGRLLAIAKDEAYKALVINLVTLSPLAMQVLSGRIQQDINAFAPNVRTRVVNGMIFLEGTVDSYDQAKRAFEIAKLYLPEAKPQNILVSKDDTAQVISRPLVQNFIVIQEQPKKKEEKLVRVTVHFVELAKDYNRLFGFKWEPGFTADPQISIGQNQAGEPGATGPSFSATISSLIPKLQSAQKAGFARILKTGTLIMRSGQPGELNEQTEFPFTMTDQNGRTIAQKAGVGLAIAVTPSILGQSEDISLDLELNQVNLTGRAPAAGAAPTTSNHRVKTKIYIKNNESAAVAAVMSSDIGTDFNKDDPMGEAQAQGNTDVLFSLLRSKAYRKKKSQFVIFVTPTIIENASQGTEDLRKNFKVKVK
ncbi:MAG: hypothetical protein A3K03_07415 [Bdellovibrionales bacterium RIFOXYD1_FULL_44_7]|nr:MAG: hypothetical protein A3K03_07415 [Bdellovibrionales bacterium RIFOXYD1_FULL_44_7]